MESTKEVGDFLAELFYAFCSDHQRLTQLSPQKTLSYFSNTNLPPLSSYGECESIRDCPFHPDMHCVYNPYKSIFGTGPKR